MKKEIKERKDVELLVNSFYQKVNLDLEIGAFFNEISGLDWNTHLPKMYDFWSTILLDEISYSGNPMTKHIALDKKATLKPQHFNKWLSLWIENIQGIHFLTRSDKFDRFIDNRFN